LYHGSAPWIRYPPQPQESTATPKSVQLPVAFESAPQICLHPNIFPVTSIPQLCSLNYTDSHTENKGTNGWDLGSWRCTSDVCGLLSGSVLRTCMCADCVEWVCTSYTACVQIVLSGSACVLNVLSGSVFSILHVRWLLSRYVLCMLCVYTETKRFTDALCSKWAQQE
jgi:hypothetical protein